ncbi:hypothetical protein BDV98DRAFT_563859 [Pterulicium gracile]|uniref:Macrofage activating glycoprotein n=1 Tax=Pterulicium gracile TaxID=1884261 RepID=A0A5C3QSE9_9AGAR|nr:hypothetical protein BDV98DRAFT_563859 [Pterula gracilis]
MSLRTLSTVVAIAVSVASVKAQDAPQETFPAVPLAEKKFSYPDGIPYQVDTDTNLIRGFQSGYNLCNTTTEGQDSKCQTSFFNSLDDFCLWAPMEPNSAIADTEGEEVAWCTKPGRGTRLIPEGTFTGLQYIKTPDYIQIVGFMDGTKINIKEGDFGGELDPHGADLRGNPMGGLMYSNAFSGGGDNLQQVIEWTNFMGSKSFCFKACDPAGDRQATLCEHKLDRIGCNFNMPNLAQDGVFESCEGESQDPPGVYVENGVTQSFNQPGETEVPNPTYTPRIPVSSNCQTFTSTEIFAALATVKPDPAVIGASSPGSATTSGTGSSSAGGPRPTNSGAPGDSQDAEGSASVLGVNALGIVGALMSMISAMLFV